MKHLDKWREDQVRFSTQASQNARQLALAAVGIIWVFTVMQGKQAMQLPMALVVTLTFVVAGLVFDFLQYLYSSAAWSIFNRRKEEELGTGPEAEYDAPPCINWPNAFFFWAKMVMILAAYVCLALFLLHNLIVVP